MSDEFNPLEYTPTQIEIDRILPLELSTDAVDKLLDRIEQDIQNSGTVKEILGVLGVAGKFAIKLGVEAAASSMPGGSLGNLEDMLGD